ESVFDRTLERTARLQLPRLPRRSTETCFARDAKIFVSSPWRSGNWPKQFNLNQLIAIAPCRELPQNLLNLKKEEKGHGRRPCLSCFVARSLQISFRSSAGRNKVLWAWEFWQKHVSTIRVPHVSRSKVKDFAG